jgi:hypothetical protein
MTANEKVFAMAGYSLIVQPGQMLYCPPEKLFKNKMLRRRCGKVDKKAVVNRYNLY